ncbi:hypothetical protein M0G43_06400 [Subsaxibacter sp. CAU 1640]|uniref:DUF6695 family protein n=1 Tax=Subsaxibacter sp. CAU 1640 TaxID=2933271 RepID=UPI002003D04E|nr:DUF6695 family protein [Subsaxibacter sp. CAU 1640]MCK7590195.1 hypothetical protein [Subsaxibacter sp. CAU 1640]
MENTGIILTLAYPETIVMVADEWYSPYMRYFGIGKKDYVRAGHAALVLIDRQTGILEYHDFGRYITPEPYGRVRGKDTDHELDFPIQAEIQNGIITNLNDILKFLATNPKKTHGDGTLYASVCKAINYQKSRKYITMMQNRHFLRYAAFIKNACNCARFVTDSLIAGTTDKTIKRKLARSKLFTPSTIGNVVIANTEEEVFEVSEAGEIGIFKSSVSKENRRLFLDKLSNHQPNFVGTLKPKHNDVKGEHAQWLSGIAAGAWFELYDLQYVDEYRFRRISPDGHIDVDGIYKIDKEGFDMSIPHQFIQYSNCSFFYVKQNGTDYRFDFIRKNEDSSSAQKEHST